MRIQRIKLSCIEDINAVQAGMKQGVLVDDVRLGRTVLRAGTHVLTSHDSLLNPMLPLKLELCRDRVQQVVDGKSLQTLLQKCGDIVSLAKGPLLLLGWGHLSLRGCTQLASVLHPQHQLIITGKMASAGPVIINATCCALYAHLIIDWWRDRRSRGCAALDVLGWESSLKEAQVNALRTLLRICVWSLYSCSVLWAAGFELGNLLLLPSVAAVFLSWVGRDIVANMISGVILHLTQPFAQGDWVTLEGPVEGWVQDVGLFYTLFVQSDKCPLYVPNSQLVSMNIQNNSRRTHRRVLFDLQLRFVDIPKISQIVADIQHMIDHHEDIDNIQHRLVRWRSVGEWSANIWVSCYTHPTVEGIGVASYSAVEQSVLERCAAIIFKHGADFASATDRYQQNAGGRKVDGGLAEIGKSFFETFNTASVSESELDSREQVLRQREKEVKEQERDLKRLAEELKHRQEEVQRAQKRARQRMENTSDSQLTSSGLRAKDATPSHAVPPAASDTMSSLADERGCLPATEVFASRAPADVTEVQLETKLPDSDKLVAAMKEELEMLVGNMDTTSIENVVVATAFPGKVQKEDSEQMADAQHSTTDQGSSSFEGVDKPNKSDFITVTSELTRVHDGEALHDRKAENTRIPVKEMGD